MDDFIAKLVEPYLLLAFIAKELPCRELPL